MRLKEIYKPIEKEINGVEKFLNSSLKAARNSFVLKLNRFLLDSPGKRIRPALVILCAKASMPSPKSRAGHIDKNLIKVASAVELIHMASLVHDDVIDYSRTRHNKPTVNSKWGEDVAITLGDYLYSVAFDLAAECGNMDILRCISSATKAMCEGELFQVCERDNIDLLKEQYFMIVKKKTASLFGASCRAGGILTGTPLRFKKALSEFGLNMGVSFQIIDDCMDIAGDEKELGKKPGQDFGAGEITLPFLYLMETLPGTKAKELRKSFLFKKERDIFHKVRSGFFQSEAGKKTLETALSYVAKAKEKISPLPDSPYKDSLFSLSDFIVTRGFQIKTQQVIDKK